MNKGSFKCYTYKFNMTILNLMAIILFFIIGSLVLVLEYQDSYVIEFNIFNFFIILFIWLILHELLHGIGFYLFKEVSKRNITFGMFLEKGVFYCMCKQEIGKKIILTSLLFPVTIIGVITLVVGMIVNSFLLVYLSVFNIVSSIGDIVMIIYFLRSPNDIIYLDMDDCTSFSVISDKDISNIGVLGIKLDSIVSYDCNKMRPADFRKLVISKGSWVLLIVIFILMVINIVGGLI